MGCCDRAKCRAQLSCPGWAMLFVPLMQLINICSATKKLLGYRSVGSCQAVGQGRFCPAAFSSAPLISAGRGHTHGIHTKWRMLNLIVLKVFSKLNYSVFLFIEPQFPQTTMVFLLCFCTLPGRVLLERTQGEKPILNLFILLVPVNLLREVLTVQTLLGTIILWCVWILEDQKYLFMSGKCKLHFFFLHTWAILFSFDIELQIQFDFLLIWGLWLPVCVPSVALRKNTMTKGTKLRDTHPMGNAVTFCQSALGP